MKARDAERQSAIEKLREWVKPGDLLHTQLKHVSRSGMLRVVQIIQIKNNEPSYLGWLAAKAIGLPYDTKRKGIRMGGCGTDMGFQAVYNLGWALFPKGFTCIGPKRRCPSNDHAYGDQDYRRHHHKDGGYALRQRWI